MKRLVSLCILLACLAAGLIAQNITGSIVGTVTDATGAAVPNATVTVTNTDQNAVVRTTHTDTDGNYSAPLLPIGHYSIAVEAKGFKKSIQRDITLNANQNLTVSAKVEVGEMTQEVSVEANAVQVELQEPVVGNLIEGNQIRELSLNSRNYEQLVTLMPGVTNTSVSDQIYVGVSNPLSGVSNAVTFAINGARTDQNNWTVDGADNVDRGANLTLLNYPSVDSIAEVKVLRGVYSAEFGRNAGGQVNVITRSGNNALHFSAYEFFRNDKLAANNFFSNLSPSLRNSDGTAKVAPLRYNDFGGTIGGPVYLGKLYNGKNKTFFFFSEEVRRVINYTPVIGTAPTADEKKGIFPNPICTSFSGSTCLTTATQITNIDPVAQAYIKDIWSQIPDAPASHNINTLFRNVYNSRQEAIKIDHVFNDKWSINGRYIQDTIPTIEPRGLFTGAALPGVSTTSTNAPGHGINVRLTGSIKPTLVNEAGYSYSYGAVLSDPIGLDATVNSPDINVKLPYAVTLGRIPTLSVGGMSSITGYGPYRDYNRNHNWFDTLTKIHEKHTIKLGVTVSKYQKIENNAGNNVGSFSTSTTPRAAGATSTAQQGWANFLLGNISSFSQSARDITPDIHQNQAEFFAQDDIRVRRNLTINIGMRYSLFRQPTDANGYLNTFDPAKFNPANAPQVDANGNLVPGTGDPLNGQVLAGKNSRFGSKISNENYKSFAPRMGLVWDPFGTGKTSVRMGYGIAYDTPPPGRWEDPIFANPISVQSTTYTNTTFSSITSGTVSVPLSPPALTGIAADYKMPYVQQYSFTIQRQIGTGTVAEVGYVGSKGTHLWGEPDINQLPPGYAVALGIQPPNGPLTTTTDPRVNAYRPYRGYRAINVYEPWFNSNYNSLQTMVRRRFKRNGFFTANYTFAKTLTDAGSNAATPQNFYDRSLDRGHSPYDRNHVFTASYSYELPFLLHSGALLRNTLGGWQASGIFSAASGLWSVNPSDSSLGTDPGGLGILGAGSGATPRADFICDPNQNAPHTLQQWFNTSCMTDVPAGQIRPGNAPRNGLRAPGYWKIDFSMFKNFHITEKLNMQFRAETFNTLNHTNFASISGTLGSTTFGQVTAARDARIIQFGLKLSY